MPEPLVSAFFYIKYAKTDGSGIFFYYLTYENARTTNFGIFYYIICKNAGTTSSGIFFYIKYASFSIFYMKNIRTISSGVFNMPELLVLAFF